MKLRLVSIPYTGTRFVRRVLVDNGHTPDEQVHTFVKADWHRWFTEDKVVVPLRDPIMHAISCVNRGKDDHRMRLGDYDVLAGLATESTHFYRVDAPDRHNEASRLADFLETDSLTIDWTPIGSRPDHTALKAAYQATGIVPRPKWLSQIGRGARSLLLRHGYDMAWLHDDVRAA